MAIMLANVGAAKVLTQYFITSGAALTLKLFATNVTPADTDVAGTYTEASGGGYVAKTLAAASWVQSFPASNIEQVAYASQTFTFTGALTTNLTIYGYYIVDAGGVLIYAEAGTPFTPANNGDTYSFVPVFQLSHGTPTS